MKNKNNCKLWIRGSLFLLILLLIGVNRLAASGGFENSLQVTSTGFPQKKDVSFGQGPVWAFPADNNTGTYAPFQSGGGIGDPIMLRDSGSIGGLPDPTPVDSDIYVLVIGLILYGIYLKVRTKPLNSND